MQNKNTSSTNGQMLSYLLNTEGVWLWIDCTIYNFATFNYVEGSIDPPPSELTIPPEVDPEYFAILISVTLRSQMRFCVRSKGKTLIYDSDLQVIEACPVILASTLSYPENVLKIERRSPYPPLEHGTAATVFKQAYHITDLPKEAQGRQKQISKMLEALPTQPIETPDGFAYPTCPKELTNMIQQLAQDYYQHHQSLQAKNNLPRAINPFESGIALASTSSVMQLLTYATQNAIAGATRWKKDKDHRPHFSHNGHIIEYGETDTVITDEAATSLWEQVKQQNFTVVDMATFAISLCARSLEPDHSAWVYAEKFIESRGLAKMKKAVTDTVDREAGHQQKNQKDAQQSIFHLEKLWMTINQDIDEPEYNPKTKKRKKRKFTYKGRFIVIKGVLTQKDLGTTDSETSMEVAWHIAPGDWLAPFLEYPNRQIANLSDRILRYDPYRQKWEKSFGYYFFFNGHMNSKGRGCTFNRFIEPLLKECSLDGEIERGRPQRTRDRFEKAMNKLVEDRLINEWHYTDHKNGYIPSKRSWIDEWLGLKVAIEIAPEKDLLP